MTGCVTGGSCRVEFKAEPYGGPAARALVAAIQAEYTVRYGGEDATPVDASEFAPPDGLFLIAYDDGVPVGCGGWRRHSADAAELKRMFVMLSARGRGVARALLAELEATAAAAGFTRIVLETGDRQPEAIALYSSSGYRPAERFGYYRDASGSRYLGKQLG